MTTSTTQTSQQNAPTAFAGQNYTNAINQAAGLSQTPYNPATNVGVAGLTQPQTTAFSQLQGIQGTQQPYLDAATNYANMGAAPISSQAIQGYLNPYQSQVTNATMAQLANQQGQQSANLTGSLAASGAFGGDRSAVAQGILANQQSLASGQTLAGLNNQNYSQALSAAQQDSARQMQTAYTMGNLGQETVGLGLQGAQAGLAAGNQLQAQQQSQLNAGTQNAVQQTMWPYQNTQYYSGIAGALGPLLGGTSSGTSSTSNPLGTSLGLGMLGYGLMFSDEKLKHDIKPIGKTFDNQTIYKYRYHGDPTPRIGLIAQEVQKKHPEAVSTINGFKAVDYDLATDHAEKRKHAANGGTIRAFDSGGSVTDPYAAGTPLAFPSFMTSGGGSQASPPGGAASQAQAAQNNPFTNAAQMYQLGNSMGGSGGLWNTLGGSNALGGLYFGSGAFGAADGGAIRGYESGGTVNPYIEGRALNFPSPMNPSGAGSAFPQSGAASQGAQASPFAGLGQMYSMGNSMGGSGGLTGGLGSALGGLFAQGGKVKRRADGGDTSNGTQDQPLIPPQPQGAPQPYTAPLVPPTQGEAASWVPMAPGVGPQAYTPPNPQSLPGIGTQQVAPPPAVPAELPDSPTVVPAQRFDASGQQISGPGMNAPAPQGGPPLTASPQTPPAGQNTVQDIVAELRAGGASEAAIRGILANIKDESSFNAGLRHPDQPNWSGEAHFAHGLYQEGGQEWNNYQAWLTKNHPNADWRDPKLQTQFLVQNLKANYPHIWDSMNKGTPEQAAQSFVTGYLRPRADLAQQRVDMYGRGVPDIDYFMKGNFAPKGGAATPPTANATPPAETATTLPAVASQADEIMRRLGYAQNPDQKTGGILSKIFGNNRFTNDPLGITGNPLVMAGMGQLASGTQQGLAMPFTLQQQQRQHQIEAYKLAVSAQEEQRKIALAEQQAKLLQMQANKPFPIDTRQQINALGQLETIHTYGVYDPKHPGGIRPTGTYQTNQNGDTVWTPWQGEAAPAGAPGANPAANTPPAAKPATAGQSFNNIYNWQGKTEDEYLRSLPPVVASGAKAVADYKSKPKTGKDASQGEGLGVMTAARALGEIRGEPYDEQNYEIRNKARKEFSGDSKTARTLRTGNTAIGHLTELANDADDLNSFSSHWGNWLANAASTPGATPRQRSYRANAALVAEELTTFYRETGGAEADIVRLTNELSEANTPAEQKAVIGKLAKLAMSRAESVEQTRDTALGKEGSKYPVFTDATKKRLGAIMTWATQPDAKMDPALRMTDEEKTASAPVRITGDDDEKFKKLPSGSLFIGPDNHIRRKP